MSSSSEFVEYVCKHIEKAGDIRSRKMFGEYGIYLSDKMIAIIADDIFYVKKTCGGAEILAHSLGIKEAPPYKGAKPCFVIDSFKDTKALVKLIKKTYEELPKPKPKKKKKSSAIVKK